MRIQTEGVKKTSRNGKSEFYSFFHPRTLRRCFAWFPVSQIKKLSFGEIEIPDWLWDKTKNQL